MGTVWRRRADEILARNRNFGRNVGDSRDRLRDDGFRRGEILLQEHRRESQSIADVIEPVAGIVRRKSLVRVEIDAEKIADRISVFYAVEAANCDSARIRVVRVRLEHRGFDPVDDLLLLLTSGLWLFRWRHQACADVFEDLVPKLVIFEQRRVRLEFVQSDIAFIRSVAVAVVTILLKDWANVFAKGRDGFGFACDGRRDD